MPRQSGRQTCALRGRWLATVQVLALASGVLPVRAARAEEPVTREPLAAYLDALERGGQTPRDAATADRLRQIVVDAEGLLARGDVRSATSQLFAVVEGRRFDVWAGTPAYHNAEFLLGRALARARAYRGAEAYLARVLARGPQSPYFVPAFRAFVDVALETGRYAEMVDRIGKLTPAASLPTDSAHELAYLQGRGAWGDWPRVDAALARVGPTSRLHPAALYFRALAAVQAGDFAQARAGFCRIAEQKDQDRLTFNVDQRFFRLKDMARLALGRLAHEQGKYDQAYYHYFSIPQESERLSSALFEASWSMSQQGQFVAARAFADQFDATFPTSPLRPEMALLRANLAVKTCNFDGARAEASALVARYQPLSDLASKMRRSEADRERLLARLAKGDVGDGQDAGSQLLRVLKLDQEFTDLVNMLGDIDSDLAEALTSMKNWRALGALAQSARKAQPPPASAEAVAVLEDARKLLDDARSDPRLAQSIADLILDASLAAYPISHAGPYEAEARRARELAKELTALRADTVRGLRGALADAVAEADERLRNILAKTRLVHIDAVVGKKKKLELQIGALAEGRIPMELFNKMQAEGAIADDEIYWPFEGEEWNDEYENFR